MLFLSLLRLEPKTESPFQCSCTTTMCRFSARCVSIQVRLKTLALNTCADKCDAVETRGLPRLICAGGRGPVSPGTEPEELLWLRPLPFCRCGGCSWEEAAPRLQLFRLRVFSDVCQQLGTCSFFIAINSFVGTAAGSGSLSLSGGTNSYFFFYDTRLSVSPQKRVEQKRYFLAKSMIEHF